MSTIRPRSAWGPAHGTGNPRQERAAPRLVIHHAYRPDIPAGTPEEAVAAHIRAIERHHAKTLTPTNPRIAYGHLVDQDGRAWQGLGFGRVGAHAAGVNATSEAICFLIDSTTREPSAAAMAAAKVIIRRGVGQGWLAHDYQVSGHRDHTAGRTCPGARLYARLQELAPAAVLAAPKLSPLAQAIVDRRWASRERVPVAALTGAAATLVTLLDPLAEAGVPGAAGMRDVLREVREFYP